MQKDFLNVIYRDMQFARTRPLETKALTKSQTKANKQTKHLSLTWDFQQEISRPI